MLILIIAVYIFAIILIWHEKRWCVFRPIERIGLYCGPTLMIVHLFRSSLFFGSIIGLFFYMNIIWALVAWILGNIITIWFQKYYFRKRVKELIKIYLDLGREDHGALSNETILEIAEKLAYENVIAALYEYDALTFLPPEERKK